MDNLSSELQKLKIDKSKRPTSAPSGSGWKYAVIAIIAVGLVIVATQFYSRANAPRSVETVRPRVETSSQSAVLVATGYVIAHHKIQVGSKIMGRVAWIGVEKGDRVRRDQVVVRLEDREYRAQHDQAISTYEGAQARL